MRCGRTHHAPPTRSLPLLQTQALNDWYAAYNKPGAVVDWLAHVTPKEDYVLVIDSGACACARRSRTPGWRRDAFAREWPRRPDAAPSLRGDVCVCVRTPADMLLLRPFSPAQFNMTGRGWVISADYTYLIGVGGEGGNLNDLWKNHIPEVGPRNDTLAGPKGRHADQASGANDRPRGQRCPAAAPAGREQLWRALNHAR